LLYFRTEEVFLPASGKSASTHPPGEGARQGTPTEVELFISRTREEVDLLLPSLLPSPVSGEDKIHEAMAYALLAPGKRIRPVLTMAVVAMYGSAPEGTLAAACSTEMVHAASLILDDLPSMDGSRMRRGKPSTHVVFGESTAILAAVALLNHAYGSLSVTAGKSRIKEKMRCSLAGILSQSIGNRGVIGGQQADLDAEGKNLALKELEFIHSHKTGSLFIASAEMGALLGGASDFDREELKGYAKNLGLAFQITDDILDVAGLPEQTGKPTGGDASRTTFVDICGLSGARKLASELVGSAVAHLSRFGKKSALLEQLALLIANRES
jgi:geranylgeranyl diphosphate synthase type II